MASVPKSELAQWNETAGLALTTEQLESIKTRANRMWQTNQFVERVGKLPGEEATRKMQVVGVRYQPASPNEPRRNLTIKITKVGENYLPVITYSTHPTAPGHLVTQCRRKTKQSCTSTCSESTICSSTDGANSETGGVDSDAEWGTEMGDPQISVAKRHAIDFPMDTMEKHCRAHSLANQEMAVLEQENKNLDQENGDLKAVADALKRKVTDYEVKLHKVKRQRDDHAAHVVFLKHLFQHAKREKAKDELWKQEMGEAVHRAADEKVQVLLQLAESNKEDEPISAIDTLAALWSEWSGWSSLSEN